MTAAVARRTDHGNVAKDTNRGRAPGRVAAPRLARHTIHLPDGHPVGVTVAGKGVPLVVVHGFTAEGFLYAQTLSRLVSMGFKVVAVDTASHGGTAGLPDRGANLKSYAELLGRILDELGIRRAVFAGHSMGGRLVVELVAREPRRGIAVILINAIVGDTWDGMVQLFRVAPPLLVGAGAGLAIDTATTFPLIRDPAQAAKLVRLLAPTVIDHVRQPWRMVAPALSILRSGSSGWMLERLAQECIPVVVIHGERDVVVPLRTARDAARRARGELVVVHGGTHSWLLKDPESLPAIMAPLLDGPIGDAYWLAVAAAGLDPETATVADIERGLYDADAPVLALTPPLEFEPTGEVRYRPRYRHTRVPAVELLDGKG